MAASCGALNEEANVPLPRQLVNGLGRDGLLRAVDVAAKRHAPSFPSRPDPVFDEVSRIGKETNGFVRFGCAFAH